MRTVKYIFYLCTLILLISSNVFAQATNSKDVALVIGGDCHEYEDADNMVALRAIKASQRLKRQGFDVKTLYGKEDNRANQISTKLKSSGIIAEKASLETIKNQLSEVYNKDCAQRPKKLMLNFMAHGSANGPTGATNHSICVGHSKNRLDNQIYMRDIAKQITLLKNKKKCAFPKIGIVDCSCKSGGSLKEFKNLGCTISMAGDRTTATSSLIDKYLDGLKSKKEKSLSDIHLDLLLNREYRIYKSDKDDDVNGKYVLESMFKNSNQISMCEDQVKGRLNITKPHETLTCSNPVELLEKKRELEFEQVEAIVKRLRVYNKSDKQTIANAMGKDLTDVPDPAELSSEISKIITEDQKESSIVKGVLLEESKIMNSISTAKVVYCRPNVSSIENTKLKSALTIPLKDANYKRPQLLIAKKLCIASESAIYADDLKIKSNCSDSKYLSKKYDPNGGFVFSKGLLLKLYRDLNLAQEKESVSVFRDSSTNISNYPKTEVMKAYKNLISSCVEKESKKDESFGKVASFLKSNFMKSKNKCSVNPDSILCIKQKSEEREKEIKSYLGMARAYYFLDCKSRFKDTASIKSCNNFKI